jgi:GTPase
MQARYRHYPSKKMKINIRKKNQTNKQHNFEFKRYLSEIEIRKNNLKSLLAAQKCQFLK